MKGSKGEGARFDTPGVPCTPGVPLIISRIRIVISVPIATRNPDPNSYNMVKREVGQSGHCASLITTSPRASCTLPIKRLTTPINMLLCLKYIHINNYEIQARRARARGFLPQECRELLGWACLFCVNKLHKQEHQYLQQTA